MNGAWIATIAILIGGVFAALQSPTNAMLSGALRSPVTAAFCSFLIGTLVLAAAVGLTRTQPDVAAVRALPWYAWLGGVYGAWFVVAAAHGAPKIGVGALVVFFLLGQLSASVAIDHFGWLGVAQRSVSWTRVAGLALVLAGAILVRRG